MTERDRGTGARQGFMSTTSRLLSTPTHRFHHESMHGGAESHGGTPTLVRDCDHRMNEEALLRRRDRTHAIVEGALLGDIAIVFLLMRVYMPILIVRTLIRAVASVPFVMLTQRRGLRVAILAGIASYVLFSALVGPILALAAVDVAV